MDRNLASFDASAERYAQEWHLHLPERVLLKRLRNRWHEAVMLDIGVGGGRTAFTFGAICKRYIGIDYSPRMIDIARTVVGEDNAVSFEICDARDLSRFGSASFDVVLYSFNGIDYVGHEDRLNALREIRRVIRNDGTFFFSSHSLQALPLRPRLRRLTLRNPLRSGYYSLRSLKEAIRLWRTNRRLDLQQAVERGWVIHRDELSMVRADTYYVSPSTALEQLADAGFAVADVLDIEGKPVDPGLRDSSLWLSYVCAPS